MKKTLLLFLLIKSMVYVHAQLSTKHYLPPIYANNERATANVGSSSLYLSTPVDSIFTVSIYVGASKKPFKQVNISSKTPKGILLGKTNQKNPNIAVGEGLLNKKLEKYGYRLEADIPFFASIRCQAGAQGIAISSKGQSALGTDFRAGHMLISPIKASSKDEGLTLENRSHFISIMATENNTKITLSNIKKGVIYRGLPTSGKSEKSKTTATHSITLNKFEVYVLANIFSDFHFGDENNSFGTSITSSKPIAVNIGSVLANSPAGRGNDNGADQIVPVDKLGKEYVLLRGQGVDNIERPVVVATKNGTKIKLNGEEVSQILNDGDYFVTNGDYNEHGNLHISANEDIYVYQTMAGAKSPPTCGLNFIPPLNECSKANKISIPYIHALKGSATINIVTKEHTEVEISDEETGKVLETLYNSKSNVSDPTKSGWVTLQYRAPEEVNHLKVISDDAITVAMTNNYKAYGAASYYSGFTAPPVIAPDGGSIAFYKNKELSLGIKGNKTYSSFEWYYEGNLLKKTRAKSIVIDKTGSYYVVGVDNICGQRVQSPSYTLTPIKEIVEVEAVYAEKPHNEIEKAILEDKLDPTVLVNLNYKYNSPELTESSIAPLDNIIETLHKHQSVRIQIRAHTDCKGKEEYNLKLSQNRADFVKAYMVEKGISADRLEAVGLGESEPLPLTNCSCEDNSCSETALALNRRSEFRVLK